MTKLFLVALLGAFLAACGGSGGGDGAAAGRTPVATAVLDSGNAVQVAGTTADAALFSAEFDELANLGVLGSPGGALVVQSGASESMTLAKQSASLQAVSIGPESQPCPFGGSMTISATIENPEVLTAGDTFSLNYINCNFGEGLVANGGMSFTVTSFSGDMLGEDFSVGFDLDVTGFSMNEGGENVSLDGDISLSMTMTATSSTVTMSGTSLHISNGVDFYDMAEFSTTTTIDMSMFPESFSMTSHGFLMSSDFDGEVEFQTTIALQGSGEGNPVSGEFEVIGADGATVRVIPMDEFNVRVELDLNGDGAVDTDGTIDMSWQEFLDTPPEA